ncbi:MAG: hypothetical protein JO359_10605, partial [Candidatus Eremiobacteraeota bacterium]|nr:hypothetical protein [Candidatus Eremiobacteraeota bacterium]
MKPGTGFTLRRRSVALGVAIAFVLAVLWLGRDRLIAFGLSAGLRLATGYSLQIGKAQFGSAHAALFDVRVTRRGEPVLDARRIDVDYALRDVFPGGEHRYGFVGLAINRPHLYLIRHRDGSFNVASPGGQAVPTTTRRVATPYFFTARVTGGSLDLIDATNPDPSGRSVRFEGLHGAASVKTDERTRYRFDAELVEGRRAYPLHAGATIDVPRGYGVHRFTIPDLPLRGLGNFLIDSNVAQVRAGHLRDLDVRLYALDLRADEPVDYHLGGRAYLDGVGMKLDVLTKPVVGMRGEIVFADGAIAMPRIDGQIGTTALRGAGGMYDFSNPQFRLAVTTREDLSVLHRDFNFLKTEPLAGPLAANCLLKGDVGNPLILADASSPLVTYGTIPVREFRASIGYHDGVVIAGGVTARVGNIATRVAGRFLTSAKDVDVSLALEARAPAGAMPYLDRLAPHAASQMTLVGNGQNLLVDARGLVDAEGNGESASGLFALNPHAVGELGPFAVRQAGGGALDGAFVIDRER